MAMLTVFHAPRSRSQRVVWLCEELGLQYRRVDLVFPPAAGIPADFWKASPLGRLPALQDADITLTESGAIVDYLVTRYGKGSLGPPNDDPSELANYLFAVHFSEATLMTAIVGVLHHEAMRPPDRRVPIIAEESRTLCTRCFDLLAARLQEREFVLARGFSAADVMLGYALHLASRKGYLDARWPSLLEYVNRLAGRPAFKRAWEGNTS